MKNKLLIQLLVIETLFSGCGFGHAPGMEEGADSVVEQSLELDGEIAEKESEQKTKNYSKYVLDLSSIPAYSGKAYVTVNDNVPNFSTTDLVTTSYEK